MTTGGIQSQIYTQPAPAVAGDFASANPRYSTLAGPGGVVAGPSGLTIGAFAWLSGFPDGDGAPAQASNSGSGNVAGFVGRNQQGLITTYLTSSGMVIPAGFQATIFSAGDFWIKNGNASIAAEPGMKAYANFATGAATFGLPATPTTTTQTTATIATGTAATFTGSIAGEILTITGAVANTLYLGALLSGTGVATGTQITSQLTGAAGAAGTYTVNVGEQSVASTALTATPYLAAGTGGSGIVLGSVISGVSTGVTGVVVNGVVTAIITAGTNVVVQLPYPGTGTATTSTITFGLNDETSWYCRSFGNAGELVKISNVPGLG
jgi:hypothetical protein